jgi:hypothetical protein
MKKFRQYLNESRFNVNHFMDYVCAHLGIDHHPTIKLIDSKEEARKHRSFGSYNPNEKIIHVVTAGRHPVDVMRTLAHELVHYKQDSEHRISQNSGETGSDIENEANAKAGVIMRNYGRLHPTIFESVENSPSGSLHAFDIDGTLMHTSAKVHVIDPSGKRVQSLSHDEFNRHELPKGHRYDFSDFRSSDVFDREKPIKPMLAKLKAIHANQKANNPNSKVIMATARSNFDDKEKFLNTWRKHGVDIDGIRVERAGNIETDDSTAKKKAQVIRQHLNSGKFREAHLYDDDKNNLHEFLKLQKEFPNVRFHAHHVHPDGTTETYRGE